MKLGIRVSRWAALAALVIASTASAQKEQWLEYHLNREGRGYRYLDLTTNPPPDLKLPKLNGQAYFAHWTTPMDPAGRWLCLDRTKKSGLYDRLYFDSTGNGRLDDKTAVTTTRTDQYQAYFDPVRLVFKGEDGPVTYHLIFRFMKFEGSEPNLLAASGGYYSGKVDMGGKKRKLDLVDADVNGTFNDVSDLARECDRVIIEGEKGGEKYLGKLIEAGGQFYQIEAAQDGAFVKLQKAEALSFGKVRVPDVISNLVVFGRTGEFERQPVKGEFTLPEGKYRVLSWTTSRKDAKGAKWDLTGNNFPDSFTFQVAAVKPATLEIGEPVRVSLSASESKDEVGFNLNFRGRAGESLSFVKGNQTPPGPKLMQVSLDGTFRATNTFEFG
jgi:hypothetical protein